MNSSEARSDRRKPRVTVSTSKWLRMLQIKSTKIYTQDMPISQTAQTNRCEEDMLNMRTELHQNTLLENAGRTSDTLSILCSVEFITVDPHVLVLTFPKKSPCKWAIYFTRRLIIQLFPSWNRIYPCNDRAYENTNKDKIKDYMVATNMHILYK